MKRPFELKLFYNGYMIKINIVVHQIAYHYPDTNEYGTEDKYYLYSVKLNRKDNKILINDIRNIIADIGINCEIPKKFDIKLGRFYNVWEFEQ